LDATSSGGITALSFDQQKLGGDGDGDGDGEGKEQEQGKRKE